MTVLRLQNVIVVFLHKDSSYVAAAFAWGHRCPGHLKARSKRLHVLIHFPDEWVEDRHGCDVLFVPMALAFIGGASLRAHQCLGRPDPFRHVRHVQAMTVNLLVQVLAALLLYAEAMRLAGRIKSEGLQFTTIITLAGNLHV